jgi:hypothetical protein
MALASAPKRETPTERHYRFPVAARVGIGISYFVTASSVALAISEHAGAIFLVIIGLGLAWMVALTAIMARKSFLFETASGIANRTLMGVRYQRAAWSEIERFQSANRQVFVVLKSGSSWPIVGVAQGAHVRWRGGETRDIVGVLNDRLALWGESAGAR